MYSIRNGKNALYTHFYLRFLYQSICLVWACAWGKKYVWTYLNRGSFLFAVWPGRVATACLNYAFETVKTRVGTTSTRSFPFENLLLFFVSLFKGYGDDDDALIDLPINAHTLLAKEVFISPLWMDAMRDGCKACRRCHWCLYFRLCFIQSQEIDKPADLRVNLL